MSYSTEQEFKEKVKQGMEIFKDLLKSTGSLRNMLIGHSVDVAIDLNEYPREVWPKLAQSLATICEGVFHVSEAWAATLEKGEWEKGDFVQPRDREVRREILILEAKDRKGYRCCFHQEFEHDWEGKIQWIGGVVELGEGKGYESHVMDGIYT